MPLTTVEDYKISIKSYLTKQETSKLMSFFSGNKNHLEDLKKNILSDWDKLNPLKKVQIIGAIDEIFHEEKRKNDPKIIRKIDEFKAAFSSQQYASWKEALLGLSLQKAHEIHFVPLTFKSQAIHPIHLPSLRFQSITSLLQESDNSHAIAGSTFCTNRALFLNYSPFQENHVLDAAYSGYIMNQVKKTENNIVIALADGCGGHMGIPVQDATIAKTAHIATKLSARILAAYSHPNDLKTDIPNIVKEICAEIEHHYPRNQDGENKFTEGTTLTCGRTFSTQAGYRFIGFHIGDSMLAAWHMPTRSLINLAPAQVVMYSNSEGTAIIPTSYSDVEIQVVDTIILPETIVFALSDGVYSHLPCLSKTNTYSDGRAYRETCLDTNAIQQILSKLSLNVPVIEIVEVLANYAINQAEKERQQTLLAASEAEHILPAIREKMQAENKLFKAEIEKDWENITIEESNFNNILANLVEPKRSEQEKTFKQTLHNLKVDLKEKEKLAEQQFRQKIDEIEAKKVIQMGDDFLLTAIRLAPQNVR